MVSGKTLGIVSTIAGVTIAIASIVLIIQAAETQGALQAINEALAENDIRQALSILFNPQSIVLRGN